MAMPSAAQITRLFLYGSTTIPDLTDDGRIRPSTTSTNVVVAPAVDINDYMDNGPGRFVNAAAFEVMHKFFSTTWFLPPSPPGGYTKDDLFMKWGMLGREQIHRRAAFVTQSDFADGRDDLLERAYIWQTTGFQIDDRARFFVAADGTRTVTEFGIKQYSSESANGITPANTENFDFTGGGAISNLAGSLLKPMVDPSDIGRVVNIPFTGLRTVKPLFTSADFNAAVASLPLPSTQDNLLRILEGANDFIAQLFNGGTIRFLDSQNRPILYGTDKGDTINGSTSVSGVDISKPNLVNGFLRINQPLSGFVQNGIAYIAGKGNDIVTAGAKNDYLDGGAGNDILDGKAGIDEIFGGADNDILIGGTGNDQIYGGTGFDTYVEAEGDGADTLGDTDGKGRIIVNTAIANSAAALFIGVKNQSHIWQSPDGKLTLTGGGNWTLSFAGGSIDLGSSFASGQLGIRLIDAPVDPQTTRDIKGDVKPIDTNPTQDGDQYANDDLDNIMVGTEVEADRADTLKDSSGNDHVMSGGGDDTIYTTRGGDNKVEAGSGRDWVYGGTGKDVVSGGEGADILLGGDGADRLYAESLISIAQALTDGNSQTGSGQQGDWLAGNAGDDMLIGGVDNDALFGGGGADLLLGGAGNDDIAGDIDWNATSLNWSAANNLFKPTSGVAHPADYGVDVVYAGAGDDEVWGGRGDDTLHGETGDDKLLGNGDNDALFGGSGNDGLWGDATDYSGDVEANMGDDYLDGGANDDYLSGGAGNDILVGGTGNDTLVGGAGQDIYIFNKGEGTDTVIDTKSENNIFRFGEGVNASDITLRLGSLLLDMGNGDQVHIENFDQNDVYNTVAIDSFQFADGSTLSSSSLLARGFDLDGTDQDDTILGTNITDRMCGLGGNDTLLGGGGDDFLYGGSGNDSLIGGVGVDYLDGGEGDDSYEAGVGDTIIDNSGANTLKLVNTGAYTVSASGANLVLDFGGSGNLVVSEALRGSMDAIDGVALGDWLQGRLTGSVNLSTTKEAQRLLGGSGNDQLTALHDGGILLGGEGSDTLLGSAGSDTLHGGDGNDVIDGGDGNDVIYADKGFDILSGGAGMDTYVLGYGMDRVTVVDISPEGSVIQLDASGLQLQSLTAKRSNNDLLVEVRGTDTNMRIKDYYGAAQTSWLFKDAQGNALSAQALIEASTPQWGNLQSSLIQEFKTWARGSIGQQYGGEYVLQADGSWFRPSLFDRPGGAAFYNDSRQLTYRYSQTHVSLEGLSNVWVTTSTIVGNPSWARSQWGQNPISAYDTSISFGDQARLVSDASITLNPMTSSSANQAAWSSVAWANYSHSSYESPWSSPYSYLRWVNGVAVETITEQQKTTTNVRYYAGRGSALTFGDPGAGAVAGPLPAYISVALTHNYVNYNLGETTLSDGNHTVTADQYSAVIGGVGDNSIYGAGFAYGGTGNARLIGGEILMAGSGDQYLEDGQTMVVGDGHDTVVGRAGSRILVDPNNTGMDLLVSDDGLRADKNTNDLDDAIEAIYKRQGISDVRESYEHGGKFFLHVVETYDGYFDTLQAARSFYDGLGDSASFEEATSYYYVNPLPALFRTPAFDMQDRGQASSYYAMHPLQTVSLTANSFATLQPYLDAGLLPMKTVSFGQGLSLSDITLSWGNAISPLDSSEHVTLDLQWGADQGVRVMIPHLDDALNGTVGQFEFTDGQVVSLGALIAMAPPAPSFDIGFIQFYSGMGQQTLAADLTLGIYAGVIATADIVVQSDGVDLVISTNSGQDTLRLTGWYTNRDNYSDILLTSGNGSFISSQELSDRGLVKDGSAGNLTLYGVPDFATTFIAGPNSTLIGASGMDIYVYNAGSGEVHITDPGGGTLRFGVGITLQMVSLGLGSLLLTIGDQGDAIHLDGFDPTQAGNFWSVRNFEFADGTYLNFDELLQKGFDIRGTAGVDILTGTNLADRFYASEGNDTLRGEDGNDLLDGGAGADRMTGGEGDDIYLVDNTADIIVEKANEGTDTIITTVSDSLAAHVENLTLVGAEAINATGNSLDNVLTGNAAKNTLNGGAGADTMTGGTGDDSYYVDNTGDSVAEVQGEGTDRVISSISYTLGAAVEDLQLSGTANINATGNEWANKLTGNGGANVLIGGAGDDRLIGGLGADAMYGGASNDLYEVDNTADTVTELAGEGADTVEASVTYTLSSEVENLILTGATAVDGTGNALNNTLQGNIADNVLTGGAGNDTLNGMKGLDTLIGGLGNDTYLFEDDIDTIAEEANGGRDTLISRLSATLVANVEDGILLGSAATLTGNALSNVLSGNGAANTLDGGAGADILLGGKGNDLYIVDSQADTILENAAEGTDTVQSSVSYILADNVEHLKLTGTAEAGMGNDLANKLTGNAVSNKLWGGAGNDTLDGAEGADILFGGLGNDKYWVDSSDDLVVESTGEGTDTVYASVSHGLADNTENLVLTGNANINAVGNAGNNRLEGNAGNNVLFGGLGNDTYMFGHGSGQDIIVNFDAGKPSGDTVLLGAGIAEGDLRLTRRGDDLILSLNGGGDQLSVAIYFENAGKGANALEKIRFADGSSWNHAAVLSRTTSESGTSAAQAVPSEVRAGNPAALFDAPEAAATKAGDATITPQTVAESIAAARERFEQGLQQLKYGVDEQGSLSRSEFAERRALPLLWNLQDALLDLQLAKNADGRFAADISIDSRAARDLGLGITVLGAAGGMSGQLDQVARAQSVQHFDLAQIQ